MSNSPRIEVSEAQAAAITLSTAREVPEHSSDGRRWTGLSFGFLLPSKVDGRRISPFPAAKYDQLSTFRTLAGCHSQLSTNKKAANVSNALPGNPTKP